MSGCALRGSAGLRDSIDPGVAINGLARYKLATFITIFYKNIKYGAAVVDTKQTN